MRPPWMSVLTPAVFIAVAIISLTGTGEAQMGLPPSSPVPECTTSLQSLVNAAPRGSTVKVPACIYRETVQVAKPLTLVAQPGAEIRGSAVWSTGWVQSGAHWLHPGVPPFYVHGPCRSGSRCQWPEQVFYDGRPLEQVAADPRSGQFAVAADRTLIMADPPSGHTVEVTVRQHWLVVASDGVTVRGFTMRHAAADAQDGGLKSHGHANVTIRNNILRDVHGAVVSLKNGSNLRLLHNDIARGGQEGINLAGVTDVLVRGNRIHENNTELYQWEWEAGGLKAARAVRLTLDANNVWGNHGSGLWCDIACRDVTYSNNRIYNNVWAGIFFEISTGAKIFGNKVWNNGWGKAHWGWGAGILASSSADVEIYNNVVAWNADGITVVSARRSDAPSANGTGHHVHGNTIVMEDGRHAWALAWLQDWMGPMFSPAANNRGARNRFGYSGRDENRSGRFGWGNRLFNSLADFSETRGGQGSSYLAKAHQDGPLAAAGIPLVPPRHP